MKILLTANMQHGGKAAAAVDAKLIWNNFDVEKPTCLPDEFPKTVIEWQFVNDAGAGLNWVQPLITKEDGK
jgi:hypothetical protein